MGMSLKQIRYLYAIGVFKKDGSKGRLTKSTSLEGTKRQTMRAIGKIGSSLSVGEVSTTHQLKIGDKTYPLKKDRNGSSYPVINGKMVGSKDLPDEPMSLIRVDIKAKKAQKSESKVKAKTRPTESEVRSEILDVIKQVAQQQIAQRSSLAKRQEQLTQRIITVGRIISKERRSSTKPENEADEYLEKGYKIINQIQKQISSLSDLTNATINPSDYLKILTKKAKFDGKPKVLLPDEIDKAVASGEQELYRGVAQSFTTSASAQEVNEQFRTGDFHIGKGVFGSGTYTSPSISVARDYSDDSPDSLLRMTIPKDNIIKHDKLLDIYRRGLAVNPLFSAVDESAFAVGLGYDAVEVETVGGTPHYVVLNRSKVKVQRGGYGL